MFNESDIYTVPTPTLFLYSHKLKSQCFLHDEAWVYLVLISYTIRTVLTSCYVNLKKIEKKKKEGKTTAVEIAL